MLSYNIMINWSEMKWGSFTEQQKTFKKKYPKVRGVGTLIGFANYVLKHKSDFQVKTRRRASFYKNVLHKKK